MDTAPRLPRGRLCFGDSGILVSQPSPLGKGDRAAVDRVLSLTAYLRRSPHLSFIPLVPYPARFARHLPHAGKALSVVILFLHISCIRFDDRGIAVFSFHCLPHAGKAVLSLCHHPQPALPLRGQAKEAQEASCASLIGMHFPAEIRCIHCLMSFRIAAEGKTALPEVFLFADVAFDRPAIEESTDIEK